MEITFLGTGTSTGVPEIGCQCEVCTSSDKRDWRLRTSVLVETDGKRILIGLWPGFPLAGDPQQDVSFGCGPDFA